MLTLQSDDGITQMWKFLTSLWPIGSGVSVVYAQENGVTLPSDPCIMINTISTDRLDFNVRKMTGDQQLTITQQVEVHLQLDFFGNGAQSRASQFSTLWQDAYAFDWFKANDMTARPLYARARNQVQFINESDNFEQRWTCDAALQIAQSVTVPQGSAINIGDMNFVEVDGTFPKNTGG